ncbi:MAG: hypothetical protein ONB46_15235 [candidate division KSB1 bacterium]|nr:hypothetical protein [candidate division KSB1 bacterium]MDZ7367071.1 hypothetical protein [candidate division KSB1 bacterium]
MHFAASQKFFNPLAKSALLLQIIGLFFCGDVDCLQGSSGENCVTLVCCLLSKHTTPISPSDDENSNSCQCFCHLLIDSPKITLGATLLVATPLRVGEELHFFLEPLRNIDHPPLA